LRWPVGSGGDGEVAEVGDAAAVAGVCGGEGGSCYGMGGRINRMAASAGMSFVAKRILQRYIAKTMERFGCDGCVVFMGF